MDEKKLITSPIKAIRAKCLDCNTTSNEVKLCPVNQCPLWEFRFGKNPYRSVKVLSEEQRKKAVERLREWRKSQSVEEDEE